MIRGLLTALEMKGIQDTFIRHQLCPSRVCAEHSEVSQPRSQALDPGTSYISGRERFSSFIQPFVGAP